MKQPPFRWIETFRVIAGAGSMTDAAKILGVDQSAMSRHIASLESQLGISLFDRSKRRLRLTAEGKLLLAEADSAAEALNRFVRKANQIRQGFRRSSASLDLGDIGAWPDAKGIAYFQG
jgi:DNA-binding transcriptional LysR family regulator